MNLNGKFSIGLENIIFKPDLYLIEKNNEKYSIYLAVEFLDGVGGVQSGYNVHYKPEENIYADNIFQLIQHFNNDLETFLTRQKVISHNTNFIFRLRHFSTFAEFKPLSILKPENYVKHRVTWTFGSGIMKILGLSTSSFTDKITFSLKPEFPKMMECLYIYTDIITPTSFGGENVHLLDIIPMKQMYSKNGHLTMYKNVSVSSIENISILIRDEGGYPVPFISDVGVTAILHFKTR